MISSIIRLNLISRCLGLLVFLLIAALVAPSAAAGPHPSDGSANTPFWPNKTLAKKLSARLSDPVVVYETDWFFIIASKMYDKSITTKVAPNVVDAVDEFCGLFGADPVRPPWQEGEKGRLVYLKSRKVMQKYVTVFAEEADPDSGSPGYSEQAKRAQSFYWVQPVPYAVACGDSANFEEINQHIFHLMGHILLTLFKFNHKYTPPWLHEGYGAYLAHCYADGNILFCTQGLNHCMFGTGVYAGVGDWAVSDNWAYRFRNKRYRDDACSLEELSQLSIEEFAHIDAALSWSLVTFLIEQYPEALRDYVHSLKQGAFGGGDWPSADFSNEKFKEAFGVEIGELSPRWEEWAENADPSVGQKKQKTGKPTAKVNNANIKFDPTEHLEGFESFVGDQPRPELAPFQKKSGQWITTEELESVQGTWASVRQSMLDRVAQQKEEELSKESTQQSLLLDRLLSTGAVDYLSVEEMVAWLAPAASGEKPVNPDPNVFRIVLSYLVGRYGCAAAWEQLKVYSEGVFAEDLALLEEAARMETELFQALAEAGVSLRLGCRSDKVKLLAFEGNELVLAVDPAEAGMAESSLPCYCCRIVVEGDNAQIRCSPTHIDFKIFLNLCKNNLRKKDPKDRQGYALLSLFRGDVKNFRKEAKQVKDSAKTDILSKKLDSYEQAVGRTELLTFLAGEAPGNREEIKDRLLVLLAAAKGTALHAAMGERGRAAATRILLEHFLTENRFLRTLAGFQGIDPEADKASFILDFEDPDMLNDFEFDFSIFESYLMGRCLVEPPADPMPFSVSEGRLCCFGLDFAIFKPIFTGDIELDGKIRIAVQDGVAAGTYQTLVGFGLDDLGGYVGASSLAYLEMQERIGDPVTPVKVIESLGIVSDANFYDFHLEGNADRIAYRFHDKEGQSLEMDGRRTGRVFLWMCGQRRFELDTLEVRAKIDPAWLQAAVGKKVEEELNAVL